MKKITTLVLLLGALSISTFAQNGGFVIDSKFKPLTQEQLEMHARAEYARQMQNKEWFEYYQAEAYKRLQVLDYQGFIYYSDYALKYGWYNSKMYYDRGQAYEKLHEYRKAQKEYKKAIKTGYYPATQALEQCKENHKRWKKNR